MFSLIVATVNRITELERLLTSLDTQTCRDFEVIVIDQNPDDRLLPVLSRHPSLTVHHLRSEKGAGRARNVGLRIARGDLIAFPDDDCWYPPALLASVADWLARHHDFAVLFGTMRDADNEAVGPRWPSQACVVTKPNLWNTTIFVTAFLRRHVVDAVGFFREDIGIGSSTPYQSGEESDYFLRALRLDCKMWYDPGSSFVVHHPDLHSIERLRKTTYGYALGAGYVMRLHSYSWALFGKYLVRSLGGALISAAQFDFANARIYWMRASGQLHGYVFGPRDLPRAQSQPKDAR